MAYEPDSTTMFPAGVEELTGPSDDLAKRLTSLNRALFDCGRTVDYFSAVDSVCVSHGFDKGLPGVAYNLYLDAQAWLADKNNQEKKIPGTILQFSAVACNLVAGQKIDSIKSLEAMLACLAQLLSANITVVGPRAQHHFLTDAATKGQTAVIATEDYLHFMPTVSRQDPRFSLFRKCKNDVLGFALGFSEHDTSDLAIEYRENPDDFLVPSLETKEAVEAAPEKSVLRPQGIWRTEKVNTATVTPQQTLLIAARPEVVAIWRNSRVRGESLLRETGCLKRICPFPSHSPDSELKAMSS